MVEESRLDLARRALSAAPGDERARLAYYRAFADRELCLLLDGEPTDQSLCPRLFALEDGPVVLVFDGEERLAAFADEAVPYAALPGRIIAQALAGRGAAIGVNLNDEAAAFLMPASAVDWLADALSRAPLTTTEEPERWLPPRSPELASALAVHLAGLGACAPRGWLAAARHADGHVAHVLVFEGAEAGAEAAVAKAASEALLFMAHDAGPVDLTFLPPERCRALGLDRFAAPVPLSRPVEPAVERPRAGTPGSDPDRPPRLR